VQPRRVPQTHSRSKCSRAPGGLARASWRHSRPSRAATMTAATAATMTAPDTAAKAATMTAPDAEGDDPPRAASAAGTKAERRRTRRARKSPLPIGRNKRSTKLTRLLAALDALRCEVEIAVNDDFVPGDATEQADRPRWRLGLWLGAPESEPAGDRGLAPDRPREGGEPGPAMNTGAGRRCRCRQRHPKPRPPGRGASLSPCSSQGQALARTGARSPVQVI